MGSIFFIDGMKLLGLLFFVVLSAPPWNEDGRFGPLVSSRYLALNRTPQVFASATEKQPALVRAYKKGADSAPSLFHVHALNVPQLGEFKLAGRP